VDPFDAADIAARCFDAHPAAVPLILEAIAGATEERRTRSRDALMVLDSDAFEWRPRAGLLRRLVPEPAPSPSVDEFATAIGALMAKLIRSSPGPDRRRRANLISAVLAEAERIGREEQAERAA
jgi:hypothetical protein